MCCCPVRIKKDSSSSGVEKHDDSDREEYYFDRKEPSSKVQERTRMQTRARFERSFADLFSLPRASMLLLFVAAILAMPSIQGCPKLSPEEIARATAEAKACLRSGPRRPDPEPDLVHEAGGAVGTDQPSDSNVSQGSSDEPAEQELFSMIGDVACSDLGTEETGGEGQLLWHYQDGNGVDWGPFTETKMREWWIAEEFGPKLKVRLATMTHHIELHTLYPMGDPPMWRKTTLLSDYRRPPAQSVATSRPPHLASAAQPEPVSLPTRSMLPAATTEADSTTKEEAQRPPEEQ